MVPTLSSNTKCHLPCTGISLAPQSFPCTHCYCSCSSSSTFSNSSSNVVFNLLPCAVMTDHFGGPIPQADAGHSETNAIYGAVITVTILATVAVILRFVARRNLEAPISYEYVLLKSMCPSLRPIFVSWNMYEESSSSRHVPRLDILTSNRQY